MKSLLPAAVLLFLPAVAIGQTHCEGRSFDRQTQLALSWDACWFSGSTATSFKTYNCNPTPTTNVTGSLHLQFKTPVEVTESIAATATVLFMLSPGVALPPYYRFDPTGCAGSGSVKGIALSLDPGLPSGCTLDNGFDSFCDDGEGQNACSTSYLLYDSDQPSPGTGRITIYVTRDVPKLIQVGANQWLCRLLFNNRLRVDCAGCNSPTSITFDRLGIESADGQLSVCLTGADSPKGPNQAGLNGGPIDGTDGGCCHRLSQCCGVDTVRPTWGRIKALYR